MCVVSSNIGTSVALLQETEAYWFVGNLMCGFDWLPFGLPHTHIHVETRKQ